MAAQPGVYHEKRDDNIILAVLMLMQFDDFENPSALDWAKFGLIAVAVVLNLVVVFRGKGNED